MVYCSRLKQGAKKSKIACAFLAWAFLLAEREVKIMPSRKATKEEYAALQPYQAFFVKNMTPGLRKIKEQIDQREKERELNLQKPVQ